MNFEAGREHDLLRKTVGDFFARELPEEKIRELDRARKIPRSVWRRLAERGWLALPVPERYGGAGSDVVRAEHEAMIDAFAAG